MECPYCGSTKIRQPWTMRVEGDRMVPEAPIIDDDVFDCAECGAEFYAELLALKPEKQDFITGVVARAIDLNSPHVRIFSYPNHAGMTAAIELPGHPAAVFQGRDLSMAHAAADYASFTGVVSDPPDETDLGYPFSEYP